MIFECARVGPIHYWYCLSRAIIDKFDIPIVTLERCQCWQVADTLELTFNTTNKTTQEFRILDRACWMPLVGGTFLFSNSCQNFYIALLLYYCANHFWSAKRKLRTVDWKTDCRHRWLDATLAKTRRWRAARACRENIQENFRLCGLKYLADTFLTRWCVGSFLSIYWPRSGTNHLCISEWLGV